MTTKQRTKQKYIKSSNLIIIKGMNYKFLVDSSFLLQKASSKTFETANTHDHQNMATSNRIFLKEPLDE